MFMSIIEIFKFLGGHLIEIVAEHCVIKIKELAQMSIDDPSAVIGAELICSC